MIEDEGAFPAEVAAVGFPQGTRPLRLQVVRDVLWDRGCRSEPVVLVRYPSGQWRDEVLMATDPTVSAEFVILGYCQR